VTSTEPRQLLPREERQASILRGAAKAFAHTGYAATSMEDVAAASGITKLIVYRHFESKEELYRAVLEEVSVRLAEEFLRGFSQAERRGFTVRAVLTVARENPDGFRLLWVHAVRERQFAEYANEHHERAVDAALALIGDSISDRTFKRWAARTAVAHLFDAVLEWLDVGSPSRDDEFVEVATRGVRALASAWAEET
jgi:AcrR family transcriptional regulator